MRLLQPSSLFVDLVKRHRTRQAYKVTTVNESSGSSSTITNDSVASHVSQQQSNQENVQEAMSQQEVTALSLYGLSGIRQESNVGMNQSQLLSPNFSTTTGMEPPYESFEIDDATIMSAGGASWVNRINWLRGRRSRTPTADDGLGSGLNFGGDHNANAPYQGSVIEVDDGIFRGDDTSILKKGQKKIYGPPAKVVPSLSQLTTTKAPMPQRSDEDSLADFDDSEWTPHDSSYGAAFPLCGWIPKRIRRLIEATMIGIVVFMLVYLVVTTSIKISGIHDKSSSHNSGKTSYDVYSGGESIAEGGKTILIEPSSFG